MKKMDLQDAFEECENGMGRYDINCTNRIGGITGLRNWDAWETRPYVNKIAIDGTVWKTQKFERIDKTYTEQLRETFGWK